MAFGSRTPSPVVAANAPVGIDPGGVGRGRWSDRLGDWGLRGVCGLAALLALAVLVAIVYELVRGANPALSAFGPGFLVHEVWAPNFNKLGALTFIYGTAVTSLVCMVISVPLGVSIGLYLSMVASGRVRNVIGPLVEMLAAIPSVILGFWGIIVFGPFLRSHVEPALHSALGFLPFFGPAEATGAGLFTASLVLTIMVVPIIASISRDLFLTVPKDLQEGAIALGSTRWEVVRGVVIPSAASGVIAASFLGLGRALGEAIATSQLVGGSNFIHASLFGTGDTLAARIASEVLGTPFRLQKASLFYLGLILLVLELLANVAARLIVRRVDAHALGGRRGRAAQSSPQRELEESASEDLLPDLASLAGEHADPTTPLEPSRGLRRRHAISRAAQGVQVVSALVALAVLAIVVFSVVEHAVGILSIKFLTAAPPLPGRSGGGIAPDIVGTAVLVLFATAIALPLAVLIALYLTEFASTRAAHVIRQALDLLNGMPTILIGLFLFGLLVVDKGQSGFAGSLALAIIMLPLIARAAQEVLALVPRNMRDAADALGVSRWRAVRGIVLPSAIGGIATATILALARAAGETAPLLLLSSDGAPRTTTLDLFGHALDNIPMFIFTSSEAAEASGFERAWGAAFVLLMFILVTSLAGRILLSRSRAKLQR